MSIEIVKADNNQFDEWNDHVEKSPDAGLFHRAEALQVQESHSDTELHALVGYKGREPTGIFPLFERTKGPITVVFSPPPPLWVPRLGPAMLNVRDLKQRKLERRTQRFVEGCLEWVEENSGAQLLRVTTVGSYDDLRPFKWNDADVTPAYTYVVDLEPDADELLMRFSSDARSNIRDGEDGDYLIEEGGTKTIKRIVAQVRNRYEAQGISFNLPTQFVTELFDHLPDSRIRPYALSVDGEFVGGILALDDGECVYRWQGGVRTDTDVDIAPNDLLDWRIMREAKERGRSGYDLVGADDRRITDYKAKFAPELKTFYNVEHGWSSIRFFVTLYEWLRYYGPG